jgi:hypothetical protein
MLDLFIDLQQTSCNAKSEDAEVLVPWKSKGSSDYKIRAARRRCFDEQIQNLEDSRGKQKKIKNLKNNNDISRQEIFLVDEMVLLCEEQQGWKGKWNVKLTYHFRQQDPIVST